MEVDATSIGWCDRLAAAIVEIFNLRDESKGDRLPPRKKAAKQKKNQEE